MWRTYFQHDTTWSRERPKSEGDSEVLAQSIDAFGLQYHDKSRYSGIRTVTVRTFIPSREDQIHQVLRRIPELQVNLVLRSSSPSIVK